MNDYKGGPRALQRSLLLASKFYKTCDHARADVFDCIERYNNPTRRHSMLGYVSPIEFEKPQRA